jgi:hypothetical protein
MQLKLEDDNARWAERHNAELFRKAAEEDKKREEESARRRAEWNATPDELKICITCRLRLDDVTKAKIADSPMTHHRHSFCDPFDGVAIRGLVGVLREAYGSDEIPLATLKQLIEQWKEQRGNCAISKIPMVFPEGGTSTTLASAPSSSILPSWEQARLRLDYEKEQQKQARQAELHSPVIDFDSEGKMRLVSRTVQRWREGLEDSEFRNLIQTLHGELNRAFPESRSFNPSAVGSLSYRRIR